MTNVSRLHHALPLSPAINKAITDLDSAIAKAVGAAKDAGLPQAWLYLSCTVTPRYRSTSW